MKLLLIRTKKVLRYKSYMVLFLVKDKELIRYVPAWLMLFNSESPKITFFPPKEGACMAHKYYSTEY